MEIIKKKISELIPAPWNPRTISQEALAGLRASIDEFDLVEPIIWNKQTNQIVGGHQRYKVLEQQGVKETDVVVVDLSLEKEKALNIALNSQHITGDWTPELGGLLQEIENNSPDLYAGLNLNALELEIPIIEPEVPEGLTDPDVVPDAVKEPVIKKGDLIVLGDHRIYCADSSKLADVETLMAGMKADLVFTDPPYNVDYEGYTKEKLKIANDSMTTKEFERFLEAVFVNFRSAVKDHASLYICHPSSYQREFQDLMEKAEFEIRCQIIWAKNHFAWGFGRYKHQHEVIFYAHVSGISDNWFGDKAQSTLWEENKPTANRLHPTMKPVELIERALTNSSKPGDIVGDFFLGSGSTIIACQRTGRRCFGLEIDPVYAQVCITRWIDYCGKVDKVTVFRDGKDYSWNELV